MTISQAMWAMMGVFAFLAFIFFLGISTTTYRHTERNVTRAAIAFLGVAVASAIAAIWLSVAGL